MFSSFSRLRKVALSSLFFLQASSCFALFDMQVMMGRHFSVVKDSPVLGEDIALTGKLSSLVLHIDPIPLVPISFGATVGIPSGKGTVNGYKVESSGIFTELQVSVWSPISLLGLTPFAKGGYIVQDKQQLKIYDSVYDPANTDGLALSTVALNYEVRGTMLGLGVKYSIIPLLSAILEYDLRREEGTISSYKVGTSTVGMSDDKIALQSSTVSLGAEFSF